ERRARAHVRSLLRPAEAAEATAAGSAALIEHREEVIKAGIRATAATSLEAAEDVLEAARTGSARREARARTHRTEFVVLLALFRIRQNRIRLADVLELRLGRLVSGVGVGVVLTSELSIHLLQLGCLDVLVHAEDLVKVLVEPVLTGHRSP